MTLAPGTKLSQYEILSSLGPAAWARCIALTRALRTFCGMGAARLQLCRARHSGRACRGTSRSRTRRPVGSRLCLRVGDAVIRALQAARRAVDLDSSGHRGYHALALALFCRKEIQAFRTAAERVFALNPIDGCNIAHLGCFIAYARDWERGSGLVEHALQLNPNHPGWFWFPLFFDAYRRRDYPRRIELRAQN
jgi:hypothetical protein